VQPEPPAQISSLWLRIEWAAAGPAGYFKKYLGDSVLAEDEARSAMKG